MTTLLEYAKRLAKRFPYELKAFEINLGIFNMHFERKGSSDEI